MKKLLLWFWMLTKRLYKKWTFVAILVLIPVLVFGYGAASREDSGIVSVALAQEGSDALAREMLDTLDASSQLLRFVRCDSPQEAEDLVRAGKVDTAWIFPNGMEERLLRFAADPDGDNAIVTVLVREDNVTQMLAREKLSGLLYTYCCRIVYVDFVRREVPELAALTDAQLLEYYENTYSGSDLFQFDETDAAMANAQTTHYLTAPVRGLLAVVTLLCGLATSLYYMEDSRRGTFGWLSLSRRPLAELGCQLVSLVNVSAVVLLALSLAGLAEGLLTELLIAALYCLCVAGFCMLLRRLCGDVRVLGTLVPVLVVTMLLVCPVFFDLGELRTLQLLLPPTYYISAAYNATFLWGMPLFTAACFGLYALLGLLRRE